MDELLKLIVNVGIIWRKAVRLTARPLYLEGEALGAHSVGLRLRLELLGKRKSSCPYQDPYFVEIPT